MHTKEESNYSVAKHHKIVLYNPTYHDNQNFYPLHIFLILYNQNLQNWQDIFTSMYYNRLESESFDVPVDAPIDHATVVTKGIVTDGDLEPPISALWCKHANHSCTKKKMSRYRSEPGPSVWKASTLRSCHGLLKN